MATNPKQIKINTIAKDFNMKTKDVIDILATAGIDKKTSGTIDTDEFAVFLNHATTNHQVTNMSDYLTGKAGVVTEDLKKNETVKSDSGTKAQRAKNTSKDSAPKNSTEKEPSTKTMAPKDTVVKAPSPKETEDKNLQAAAPSVNEITEKVTPVKDEMVNKSPSNETPMKETSVKENIKEMPKKENMTKNTSFVKSSIETKQNSFEENKHYDRSTNAPQKTFASNRFDNANNMDRRQSNHAPKTQDNVHGGRPQFAQKQNQPVNNQQNGTPSFRPQQKTPVAPQPVQQTTQPIARAIPQPQPQKPKEKKEQQPLAPKTTRIVDTRTTSVDLSKYDERLENFVPESARRNNAPDRQKLKKQQNQNPYAKGTKDKKNAPDKLKKQEIKKTQLSISIPDEITVSELAQKLKVTASEVIKRLMMMGVMATVN